MKLFFGNVRSLVNSIFLVFFITIVSACAHPITIIPDKTPSRIETSLNPKKVAYVTSEMDRNRQVTSAGGGGGKVTYYPYRDLEKAIRDALRSVYSDVIAIQSVSDTKSIAENNISLIYLAEISTTSSSDSAFTWPPTYFRVELSCNVSSISGSDLTKFKVTGSGNAEFSEFKINTGLAGTRASSDLSEKLRLEILKNPALH